jgi:hypothetical protein
VTVDELRETLSGYDGRMRVVANYGDIAEVFVDSTLRDLATGASLGDVVHISDGHRGQQGDR